MRVAAFLPTHDLRDEAVPWMRRVRELFDEFIVFLDDERITQGTESRAKDVASRISHYTAAQWYDWDLAGMVEACESDWVFIIDCDEQLSGAWQPDWRLVLEGTEFTHFSFPRRWITPGETYINVDPWWPDMQMRLFRTDADPAFPSYLHQPISVKGRGATLANLAIDHHVLWLCSREERERKVRHYENQRPGRSLAHYYLYEDFDPPRATIPAIVPSEPMVLKMRELAFDELSLVSIEPGSVPARLNRATMYWIPVAVANGCNIAISACAPFPVRLSYHWIARDTGEVVLFDGERSGCFPAIAQATRAPSLFLFVTPFQAGEYVLQITMVQEHVRWFEEVNAHIIREFPVTVS